jgi:hypothetical protein
MNGVLSTAANNSKALYRPKAILLLIKNLAKG